MNVREFSEFLVDLILTAKRENENSVSVMWRVNVIPLTRKSLYSWPCGL